MKHRYELIVESDSREDTVDYEVCRGLATSFFPDNIGLTRKVGKRKHKRVNVKEHTS